MKMKGSVTVFVLLMLGFIIGFYLIGYTSPAVNLASKALGGSTVGGNDVDVGNILDSIGDTILSPLTLTWVLILGAGTIVSGLASRFIGAGSAGTGFVQGTVVSYLIPVLIIGFVANTVFFPVVPTAQSHGLSGDWSLLLTIILNVFMLLAVISWVSGRD